MVFGFCGLCVWPLKQKSLLRGHFAFHRGRRGKKEGSDYFVWRPHSESVECIKHLSRLKTDPRRIISVNSSADIHFKNNECRFKWRTAGSPLKQRFQKRFCGFCDIVTKQQFKGIFLLFFGAQCEITYSLFEWDWNSEECQLLLQ